MTTAQIQKRNGKAQHLKVVRIEDGRLLVESSKGKIYYRVAADANGTITCTCEDFTRNSNSDPEFRCKHILAVYDFDGNIGKAEILERKAPKIDPRFIKNISGKEFVLYAGLLDLAHQKGLLKLQCEILQYPNADNGSEAICKALAVTKNTEEFTDIGDANPRNTNKMIASHIIRMASTRAKARALRDLTNIGMTCLEELAEYEETTAETSGIARSAVDGVKSADPAFSEGLLPAAQDPAPIDQKPDKSHKKASEQGMEAPKKITEAQKRAALNLGRRKSMSNEDLEKMAQEIYKVALDDLTQEQASSFIRTLQSAA
jgi:SWIM zinc finger